MSTPLHDRLAELADDAPTGGPAPDLWDRGVRYRRRRRLGTAVIAAVAVVLVGVIAGVSWPRPAPSPMPAGSPLGLPDRVWTPSPWLATVDRPGQLVALTPADRGTWKGSEPGYVGVSATSGEYAFLDLPGVAVVGGEVVLAPDGRHVAYWLTGETTDTPNTASGPVTGLAVLDTATGEVARHWIATAHGLMPDFLAWSDPETVVFSAGQIRGGEDDSGMDQSSSSFGRVTAWSIGGRPWAVRGLQPGTSLEGAAHGLILVEGLGGGDGHRLLDPAAPDRTRVVEVPSLAGAIGSLPFVAVGASDDRIALVPGNKTPASVSAGPAGALTEVPGSARTLGVAAWLDDDTIVTLGYAGPDWDRTGLYRTSVSTGERQEIVTFPDYQGIGGWQFATDLLGSPSVPSRKPPEPMDPRVAVGSTLAVVGAAGALLLWWRRRVRA